MRVVQYFTITVSLVLITSAVTFEDQNVDNRLRREAPYQGKRDLSLAYSATNIKSKEGTQVKTITVIKNVESNKHTATSKKNSELNNNRSKSLKDNFSSFGVLPDVPDVEDLFEYVNKKHSHEKKTNGTTKDGTKKARGNVETEQTEKPVFEASSEEREFSDIPKTVEKISGDAELLPNFNTSRIKTRESLVNVNYSTPQHSVHRYFENYIQLSPESEAEYNYQKPCVHQQPIKSETVTTPSGKTYNVPLNYTNSDINPYIAPSITRRPPTKQQSISSFVNVNPSTFPINSLLPPILSQSNNLPQTLPTTTTSGQIIVPSISKTQTSIPTTSQRPYLAPSLRSGLNAVSRGPGGSTNVASIQNMPSLRINSYNTLLKKPNNLRSRGLKY
ncbi:uncharacterized protein LOC142236467 isoform X2 [Haematobia irritans]|uniref:uncharacterized protein LOC142236467 isoform X2 n=1 Tax=Haematobia irritans TaxID=7368 RepID=UPI003F4F6281